jgi:tetratricopeptide (TPR) repeat protein
MSETNAALLVGLPRDVQALLVRPPLDDTRLLELAARWDGLAPGQARMADALRLFVITWDPLEWLAPRPEAMATVNAWPLEIVVYVPVWSLVEVARRRETTMAAVLGGLGGRAITTAAAHEDVVTSGRYAELAALGQAPSLLSADPGPTLGEAVITAESPEWDAIGLGAITDFVQEAFGRVDLDRSLVELSVMAAPWPGCPACAGRRFKFPADLADSQDRMCTAHRKEADAVTRRRIARAQASNPAGWRVLGDASARLSFPHLPGGLATRLKAAEKDPAQRAWLLAEAASGFAGRPDDFGSALAENRDQAGRFPGWPITLIRDLGRAGHPAEAIMLSEALAVVDPARHDHFAGEAAVALAEAGQADDARAKIAQNLERWPEDVRTRVLAGDALAILGDAEAALAQFQAALPLARQAKDLTAARDLSTRIFRLTHPGTSETVQRRQRPSRPTRSQRKGRR